MPSIHEVAKYMIENGSDVTPKKLQKLCYYAEAWHNALLEKSLIDDSRFEAWVHGPVSPELYRTYRDYGWMIIDKPERDIELTFNNKQTELLESVIETYDEFSGNELEAITHNESPWINQRIGLEENESSNNEIDKQDMMNYYRSIYIGD
ncbi:MULTISPECIES: type II toxin-antitoxin system antitoxin SocA domain-containing protein [unclassified Mammaliicoccus]|uniref:Panacea domain-containing protein n=1 Tax=unclassified Mammaliicoccus TaxID=2803851 RepID=UPI001EFAC768|nr:MULTISPECIES: type II toxin-antitoxin system antitoxin SocA domain-containing protein [unclassified Mammaliicoccus]